MWGIGCSGMRDGVSGGSFHWINCSEVRLPIVLGICGESGGEMQCCVYFLQSVR